MRIAAAVLLLFVGCDENMGRSESPGEMKVDPDYVVLRPVTSTGTDTAVIHGQNVTFSAKDRILDLRHLDPESARVEPPQYAGGHYVIFIRTTDEGQELLRTWTSQHINEQLGIFVNGWLISAPFIRSTIDDTIILDGGFTEEEAKDIVKRLRRGGGA